MASRAATFVGYKLNTVFDRDLTRHTIVKSNTQFRQRKVTVETEWKKETKLGSGAFGAWRQKEKGSGELRVVKTVPQLQFCLWEVEALVELREHPELFVSFLGWFEDPYAIHLAMEYVESGDLGLYIGEYGATAKAKDDIGELTSQILEGLEVLHQKGISHRDLKPQSILIVSLSPIWIKINDFGISKRTSFYASRGKVCYQAPEQMGLLPKKFKTKESYTGAADMWALGAIVYQILTKEIPFLETDNIATASGLPTDLNTTIDMEHIFNYCRGQDSFPTEILQKKGVTTQGMDFIRSLMAVDPSARPSAADALKNPWLVRLDASEGSVSVIQPLDITTTPSAPTPAPTLTLIPSTALGIFDPQVIASLVGDRRRLFVAEAYNLIFSAVIPSVSYASCNKMLVEFCRSNKLVSAVPDHYAKGYRHWACLADVTQEPLQSLELWAKAVEARGDVEHWEKLVVRALSDLLASFA